MAEKHHSTKEEQERESEGAEEGKEEKEKEGRGGGEAEARAGNQEEKQNKQKQKKPPVNNRAMCICLCIFYTCFHITIADVSSCDRDQFTIWLFMENVCWPVVYIFQLNGRDYQIEDKSKSQLYTISKKCA